MRAIIKENELPIEPGKRIPKLSKRRYVYLEILIRHLKHE
jgi:hypothetical protein